MKTCPVCKIDYSDKAEFCKKCEAHLIEKVEKAPKVKTNVRGLIKACLYAGIFILFIMGLYWLITYLIG